MEYSKPKPPSPNFTPRIIIHGGAGNIRRDLVPPSKLEAYRVSLREIIHRTHHFMHGHGKATSTTPTALETACFAVSLLENDPLYNSAHGAVFTRDGINELEASVMVSRSDTDRADCGGSSFPKRCVGVTGLRRVKNPILLAKAMLEHGEQDLGPSGATRDHAEDDRKRDVPSAQGHTILHGPTAELLAKQYGLDLVDPSHFYTEPRWQEHLRGLANETKPTATGDATRSPGEYLPQGTCGAVAMDARGLVCAATSTGGLTNKLTGRIGDTPVPGAGFWAEEWDDDDDDDDEEEQEQEARAGRPALQATTPAAIVIELSTTLRSLLGDCLPTPSRPSYTPLPLAPQRHTDLRHHHNPHRITTRALALSGTGNGDSFLRTSAAHTALALARYSSPSSSSSSSSSSASSALHRVAGKNGHLQRSAGPRWARGTGEGEGGMIGVAMQLQRGAESGGVVAGTERSEVVQDRNCAGMVRAWVGDDGAMMWGIWDEEWRICD